MPYLKSLCGLPGSVALGQLLAQLSTLPNSSNSSDTVTQAGAHPQNAWHVPPLAKLETEEWPKRPKRGSLAVFLVASSGLPSLPYFPSGFATSPLVAASCARLAPEALEQNASMFRHVPTCSDMFRHVPTFPTCSVYRGCLLLLAELAAPPLFLLVLLEAACSSSTVMFRGLTSLSLPPRFR